MEINLKDLDDKFERIINCINDINTKDPSNYTQKRTLFSIEMIVKLGIPLIMGILAYAGMSYKIDNSASNIIEIKQNQKDDKKDSDLQRDAMRLQIQTCETQISVLNQEISDIKNNETDKK